MSFSLHFSISPSPALSRSSAKERIGLAGQPHEGTP